MNVLIRAVFLLAAGAAGWALAKRKTDAKETNTGERVIYLSDDEAVIDAQGESVCQEGVQAVVHSCYRRMNPFTLIGSTEAVFMLEDGTKVKLYINGEAGRYLRQGDSGLLTWSGNQLILFAKDNGEMIGGMYYAPAGEDTKGE